MRLYHRPSWLVATCCVLLYAGAMITLETSWFGSPLLFSGGVFFILLCMIPLPWLWRVLYRRAVGVLGAPHDDYRQLVREFEGKQKSLGSEDVARFLTKAMQLFVHAPTAVFLQEQNAYHLALQDELSQQMIKSLSHLIPESFPWLASDHPLIKAIKQLSRCADPWEPWYLPAPMTFDQHLADETISLPFLLALPLRSSASEASLSGFLIIALNAPLEMTSPLKKIFHQVVAKGSMFLEYTQQHAQARNPALTYARLFDALEPSRLTTEHESVQTVARRCIQRAIMALGATNARIWYRSSKESHLVCYESKSPAQTVPAPTVLAAEAAHAWWATHNRGVLPSFLGLSTPSPGCSSACLPLLYQDHHYGLLELHLPYEADEQEQQASLLLTTYCAFELAILEQFQQYQAELAHAQAQSSQRRQATSSQQAAMLSSLETLSLGTDLLKYANTLQDSEQQALLAAIGEAYQALVRSCQRLETPNEQERPS